MVQDSDAVEKKSEANKRNTHAVGMVMFTQWAADRVAAKRKRRGLGEIKPRKKNAIKQIITNSMCLAIGNMAVAPLERCRILLQTTPMSTYSHEIPQTTRALIPKIVQSQG